jgi:predicted DsbA family dithiol-disulfide isomerase
MALVPLSITVTSDSICPFCYLGLRKLQGALASSPVTSGAKATLKPEIRFVPFQLDPTLPEDKGINKRELYVKKFGGPQRVAAMEEMMKARGREEGINLFVTLYLTLCLC